MEMLTRPTQNRGDIIGEFYFPLLDKPFICPFMDLCSLLASQRGNQMQEATLSLPVPPNLILKGERRGLVLWKCYVIYKNLP
jgi:hypothetical protein